jgi:hypothetical protein
MLAQRLVCLDQGKRTVERHDAQPQGRLLSLDQRCGLKQHQKPHHTNESLHSVQPF